MAGHTASSVENESVATITIGSDPQFQVIRQYLASSGFTFREVLSRLHEERNFDFTKLRPGPADREPQDALELQIRVFILGESTPWVVLSQYIPAHVVTTMRVLGVLSSCDAPHHAYSPVALYPVDDVFIVSDRWSYPDKRPFKLAPDAVYPALTFNAQRFLSGLLQTPCDDLLDLCSGTGVAALLAAATYARSAVSADILQRCVTFAEFNRRLNQLQNVEVVQSDVYGAVEGRTFDRILAHPPYVPVLQPKWVYHDGGVDGENITRRIVEGLPVFLRAGGVFQCHTMASDRDVPLEQRIRGWLGDKHSEFDVVLIIWDRLDPLKFVLSSVVKDRALDDFDTWKKLFEEWHVARLLDVSITIVRHAELSAPLDIRRMGGDRSGPSQVEWLLKWERIASTQQGQSAMMSSRPRAAEGLRFHVSHIIQEAELRAESCRAAIDYPFQVNIDIDSWMPLLLTACDGQRTGRELYEIMRDQGHIEPDTPPEKFAALLAKMLLYGFTSDGERPV